MENVIRRHQCHGQKCLEIFSLKNTKQAHTKHCTGCYRRRMEATVDRDQEKVFNTVKTVTVSAMKFAFRVR